MSETNINGSIFDSQDNLGVIGARVMITDKDGNLYQPAYQVRSDEFGHFDILVPSIIIAGKYITAKTDWGEPVTIPLNTSGLQNYHIDIASAVEQDTEEEVIVTADQDAVKCIQKFGAGSWNYETKKCKQSEPVLPDSFWQKHKTKLMIAGGLIILGIIVAIIVKSSKK